MLNRVAFIFLIIGFLYSIYFPMNIIHSQVTQNEIDIALTPEKVLFDIKNGRPGEIYTKEITVKNNGIRDFNYLFSNQFVEGSENFYNELMLTIEDQTGVLFNGKLNDINKINSRILKNNTQENLRLSVEIPIELGNKYQGLNSEFQFKFYVEDTLDGRLPPGGSPLPKTASGIIDFVVLGAGLVLGGGILYVLDRKNIF